MSYAIDVNVLLYASDQANPHHEAARQFLRKCASQSELMCVTWMTIMGYLRIATHPRVYSTPLSPEEALANITRLLSLPQVRVLSEAQDFLDVYRQTTAAFPVRGNLVPDAHLAALLRQHDVCTLYTSDVDFRRFGFLDVRNPFAASS